MYKKRFAKWGFQKYSKCSAAAVQISRAKAGRWKRRPPSLPAFPGFGHDDGLKLMFLTSLRTWSFSFFECMQSGDRLQVSQQRQPAIDQLRPVETMEIGFAFKLVIELLDRGYGRLAGITVQRLGLCLENSQACRLNPNRIPCSRSRREYIPCARK